MYCEKKKFKILIYLIPLFLVASCAVLQISPPGPSVQTILVLPVKATNTSIIATYPFYYSYEIVNAADKSVTYEVIFKLPNKNGILLVDSLPPGDYIVKKVITLPIHTGTDPIKNKFESRYDIFKLESGKITILQYSLNVSVENDPTFYDRYWSSNKMSLVEWRQKDQIIKKLKELENFDKWKVLGWTSSAHMEPLYRFSKRHLSSGCFSSYSC